MSGKSFQQRITAGRFTLPVSILVAAMMWTVTFLLLPEIPDTPVHYPFANYMENLPGPAWLGRLVSFAIYLLIGYLLIVFNNAFAIIRARASVQTSFFLLFTAARPMLHTLHPGDFATVAFVLSLSLLFGCYRHSDPVGGLFRSFFFFGLGSLLLPQMVFLLPMFLLGAFFFKALTIRSFFAAVLGLGLPCWFLFGYAYYFDRMDLFYLPFLEMADIQPFRWDFFSGGKWISPIFFLVIFIVSSIHCFAYSYKDKFRTRIFLRFIISLNLYIFLYMILQPAYAVNFRAMWLIGVSVLAGHFFVLTEGKASNFFFVCVIIGSFLLSGFNIWTLL